MKVNITADFTSSARPITKARKLVEAISVELAESRPDSSIEVHAIGNGAIVRLDDGPVRRWRWDMNQPCWVDVVEEQQSVGPDADVDDSVVCETHGLTTIVESGSSPGFTGAPIYFATLACGCQLVDTSADNADAAR